MNKEIEVILKILENDTRHTFDGCINKRYVQNLILEMAQKFNNNWIPVSEYQPEQDGFYLATLDGEIAGEDKPFVSLAEYKNGKWEDDEDDYQCVLAWMPLPEAYHPVEVEPETDGWVRVSERNPLCDGTYICTCKGINESVALLFSVYDSTWMDELGDAEYEVIAWQKMPKRFTEN